jgi:hypothetical protein
MRKFSRHTTLTTTLTIAVTLISFGLLTDTSSAERFYQGRAYLSKNCNATGGIFTVENSGAFSCMRPEYGMSINCSASGSCAMVDLNRREGTPSGGPRGDGKGTDDGKGKAIANDPNRGWNGQYTTVVVPDGRGTRTYTVKQGVPIENGQMILAPNGVRYQVWDPELARQLKAAGVDAAYANPAAAKNEYALARDKVVRDRAIAAGKPVPQPTGHRNLDALGNRAPVVNDHRQGTAAAPAPGSPPPAGTVSTTPPPSNGTDSAVRDHRRTSAGGGGVTVTQTPKTAASGSSRGPSNDGSHDRKQQ